MHCHLLVPPLGSSIADVARHEIVPEGLAALLKYGVITKTAGKSAEDWLCAAFSLELQQDAPVAPFSLLGDGGVPGDGYWLRADPVTIQLMRNRLVLLADDDNPPSPLEAAEFVAALNRHFSPEGLQFSAPHPRRWYLRLPAVPKLQTHSLAQANGRNIQHFLPFGEDGAYWRRLLNEAQILLHAHPLNAAREAADKPALNSIWPWGGGILSGALSSPYSRIIADDPLARGLAMAAALPADPLPTALPQDVAGCAPSPLFVLEAAHEDPRACLDEWEKNWFAPALAALRRGTFRRLSLFAPGEDATLEITLSRFDLWKFWRRGTLPVSR